MHGLPKRHWRCIKQCTSRMISALQLHGADFMAVMKGTYLGEIEYLQAGANAMLNDLLWWTKALKAARPQL